MALVGDVILSVRQEANDPPATLPPPPTPTLTPATVGGGSLVGPIYCCATYLTPWGETAPGPEVFLAGLTGGNNAVTAAVSYMPPGATAIRFYFSAGPGAQSGFE